jgi:hypothetical protein
MVLYLLLSRLEVGLEAVQERLLPAAVCLFTLGYWGAGLLVTAVWPQYHSYC